IDTLFSGWNDDDWGETKSLIASELQKQLPHSAALSYRDAVLFVDELEHRADGELPEEIKKTLLTFHPRYRQSPHLEMVDGFTLEYRSAGAQKAKGVDFGIEYPASWEAKEGRRPNIVQVFTSDQGRGLTTANVLVKRKPDELTGSAFTEISRQDLVDIFAGTMDHVVLHDAGTADVAGSPSVWGEVESEMQNAGIPVTLHGLVFMIEKGDHLVVVNLFGGSSSAADAPSASELFAQHARTFHLMMVSFEFYDRFE